MPAKCTLGACTDIDVVVSLLQLLMLLLGESRSKSIYLKLIRKSFVMNTTLNILDLIPMDIERLLL